MCEKIPDPPPGVSTDAPPPAKMNQPDCKANRYDLHRQANSTCQGCHAAMDPVGFGLERFDKLGKLRQYDYAANGSAKMECPIDGKGELNGKAFTSPAELADVLLDSGRVEACLVERMYAFSAGYAPVATTRPTIEAIASDYARDGGTIQALMLALIASDRFLAPPKP
jgi:hypothetical protein